MKALTLHQPWASLVALGVKTIETRPWSTPYRGTLAIHAGKTRPDMMHLPPLTRRRDDDEPRFLVMDTITDPKHRRPHRTDIPDRVPKKSTTPTLFFPRRGPHGRPHQEGTPATEQGSAVYLPLGAVIATCRLVDCAPMGGPHDFRTGVVQGDEGDWPGRHVLVIDQDRLMLDAPGGLVTDVTDQRPYGDYAPGRWAWILADILPLDKPIPARGKQGLWEWDLP